METRHFIKHCMASALTAAMLVCLSLASCENKPKVTGGDIYQLYSLKNTNIEEPAWRENIVKLVGEDNYKFMCEQDLKYGPFESSDEGYEPLFFGASTKNNWRDGYHITCIADSLSLTPPTLTISITRNGKTKTEYGNID